jgi:hypothetical protein
MKRKDYLEGAGVCEMIKIYLKEIDYEDVNGNELAKNEIL